MKVNGATKWAGVIGWPVEHSRSPEIHNRWIEQANVDAVYIPLPVPIEKLESVVRALPDMGCVGVNLTVPHKEQVLPFLDAVDDVAQRIGAVNTIVMRDGKSEGYNTDAYGFWQNIEISAPNVKRDHAFVIGAGGAARAVVVALDAAGFGKITVMNRTPERAESLCDLSDKIEVAAWHENVPAVDLLVNTTTLGMQGQPELELELSALPAHAAVNDIVYTPLETGLLKQAKAQTLQTVDGLGMLIYQAEKAFELWFGVTPECSEIRNILTDERSED